MAVSQFKRPKTVFLGNLVEGCGSETLSCAKTYGHFDILGVDLMELKHKGGTENWRQVRSDFIGGLLGVADGSQDLVSSIMSVGYYDRTGRMEWGDPKFRLEAIDYTREVIDLSHAKLNVGGKLALVVEEKQLPVLEAAFKGSKFTNGDVSVAAYDVNENESTFWTKSYRKAGVKLFRCNAVKKHN